MDTSTLINLASALIGAFVGGLISLFTTRQQMKAQVSQTEKERDEARRLIQGQMIQGVILPAMNLAGDILVGTHLEQPLTIEALIQVQENWRIAARRLYVNLGDQMADKINGPVQGYLNKYNRFLKQEVTRADMLKLRNSVSRQLAAINQSIYHFSGV
jgi:hypothetical protein